jgi:hypothetical protein
LRPNPGAQKIKRRRRKMAKKKLLGEQGWKFTAIVAGKSRQGGQQ